MCAARPARNAPPAPPCPGFHTQVRTVPVIVALISSVIMMCLGTPRQLIGSQVRVCVVGW